MKAINIGDTYNIYNDTVKVYDKLPAKNYIVRFNKMSGFYLEEYPDIEINEKIYGVHEEKVTKVLEAFKRFEKNLGVILSGNKGIGKSLFAKQLAVKAVERNIPIIIVDKYISGIASYIEGIDQEVMVLFDEFDKTFGGVETIEGEADPQAGLLSLFDGISQGKKLFVVTCNDIRNLNDFLINRPGRFHYHFRFSYPTEEEIKEYLEDKLEERYYAEIDKVIDFSRKVDLNYDCLRAIAFELNCGESFETAIQDLNIINMDTLLYDVKLYFEDGTIMSRICELDLFNKEREQETWLNDPWGNDYVKVKFNAGNCKFNPTMGANVVLKGDYSLEYDEVYEKEVERIKNIESKYLIISRCREKDIHYTF